MGCGASAEKQANRRSSSSKGGSKASVFETNGKVSDHYVVNKKRVGEGSYGYVSQCKHKETKVVRAVKTISKAAVKNAEALKTEISVQKSLDHPNICKLYEAYDDHRNIYLIIELCTGGELFDRIIEVGHMGEKDAAIVMQNMLRAIYYMHSNSYTHRDLKPENFLFTTKDPISHSTLKLIDFGLACKFDPKKPLTTKAGTPYYVAPQVLQGSYNHLADVWSLGVILFVMLCGYPPFYDEDDQQVLSKVKMGVVTFVENDWKNVSEDAKDLIRKLLTVDPNKRYSAQQALQHEWVQKTAPRSKDAALPTSFLDNLRGFKAQHALKKAALQIIASNMDDVQIKKLKDIFMALDDNGDGQLTYKEISDGISKSTVGELPPDLADLLKSMDADGSGVIDYSEFLAATIEKKMYNQKETLWTAFKVFDRDGNGTISKEELAYVLADGDVKSIAAAKDMEQMMKEIDTNGDGEIDFEEFCKMMDGGAKPSQPQAKPSPGNNNNKH
eukprot:TRINITY_DN104842_c0_g1_i1.p1 TRINITY_DN104842_c0_g1~~TRINITY_DN104842_c0_g1_i1.p1  ORF type:complete len:500 (-),score=114.80 TRINITY_DN104842_c0_g1_i1:114-1613(-)